MRWMPMAMRRRADNELYAMDEDAHGAEATYMQELNILREQGEILMDWAEVEAESITEERARPDPRAVERMRAIENQNNIEIDQSVGNANADENLNLDVDVDLNLQQNQRIRIHHEHDTDPNRRLAITDTIMH